jgi:hypothetical protein
LFKNTNTRHITTYDLFMLPLHSYLPTPSVTLETSMKRCDVEVSPLSMSNEKKKEFHTTPHATPIPMLTPTPSYFARCVHGMHRAATSFLTQYFYTNKTTNTTIPTNTFLSFSFVRSMIHSIPSSAPIPIPTHSDESQLGADVIPYEFPFSKVVQLSHSNHIDRLAITRRSKSYSSEKGIT